METGKFFGGDSSFVYIGTYEMKDGKLAADIKCTNDRKILKSIFGDSEIFTIHMEGEPQGGTIDMRGYVVEEPARKILARLTRRAELP